MGPRNARGVPNNTESLSNVDPEDPDGEPTNARDNILPHGRRFAIPWSLKSFPSSPPFPLNLPTFRLNPRQQHNEGPRPASRYRELMLFSPPPNFLLGEMERKIAWNDSNVARHEEG